MILLLIFGCDKKGCDAETPIFYMAKDGRFVLGDR